MNTNQRGDDELNAVLREWVVDSAIPPRFEEQVWRRIARVRTQAVAQVMPPDEGRRYLAWVHKEVLMPGKMVPSQPSSPAANPMP